MRLRLTFAEALSGSIAGVTATNGRPGAQVRARRPHVQPRTPSQVNSRALLGQIPALWRLLTPAQQLSWAQLAKIAPRRAAFGAQRALSGYALFVSCNRNLATIGAPLLDTAADTARSFPPIHTFSAAPGYNQPNQPRYLNSLPVQIDPTIPAPFVAVIRATKGLSPGQMQIRPSDLRGMPHLHGRHLPRMGRSLRRANLARSRHPHRHTYRPGQRLCRSTRHL